MSNEDTIRMAREAGATKVDAADPQCWVGAIAFETEELERFAALVTAAKDAEHHRTLAHQQRSYEREIQLEVEAEREECAKLAESTVCDTHLPTGVRIYGTRAAAAIRARTP